MGLIPVRVIISMLGIYACALVYTQRSAMSVAIVAMTTAKHPHISNHSGNHSHECIAKQSDAPEDNSNHSDLAKPKFSSQHFNAFVRLQENSNKADDQPEFNWNAKLQVNWNFNYMSYSQIRPKFFRA